MRASEKNRALLSFRAPIELRNAFREHAQRLDAFARRTARGRRMRRVTPSTLLRCAARDFIRQQPNELDNWRVARGA